MARTESVSGHVTASVLLSILAGLAGGAIYGWILGSFISQPYLIAVMIAVSLSGDGKRLRLGRCSKQASTAP